MKITTKEYICPACGELSQNSTNHFGEIYVSCKKCNSTVLYCNEKEGKKNLEQKKDAEAIIHFYYFDLSQDEWNNGDEQKIEYTKILNKMKKENRKLFSSPSSFVIKKTLNKIFNRHSKQNIKVSIYDVNHFEEQYVSSVGRIHSWFETVYPNRNIKEGYYVELLKKDDIS